MQSAVAVRIPVGRGVHAVASTRKAKAGVDFSPPLSFEHYKRAEARAPFPNRRSLNI
jgi:hypothetical protein